MAQSRPQCAGIWIADDEVDPRAGMARQLRCPAGLAFLDQEGALARPYEYSVRHRITSWIMGGGLSRRSGPA